MSDSTNPQRVDVGRLPSPHWARDLHGETEVFTTEEVAALLQQLAEERELRMAVEKSWHHELARAAAADAPGVAVDEALRTAALALADLAERNTDDVDEWQAAIAAVRSAALSTAKENGRE